VWVDVWFTLAWFASVKVVQGDLARLLYAHWEDALGALSLRDTRPRLGIAPRVSLSVQSRALEPALGHYLLVERCPSFESACTSELPVQLCAWYDALGSPSLVRFHQGPPRVSGRCARYYLVRVHHVRQVELGVSGQLVGERYLLQLYVPLLSQHEDFCEPG